ncbi:hypothetical protein CN689_12470 [Peribacillus butanolivorans]|uniref:LysM domain-containing protein n=1 Tax=Peribacillus butanolivorans TaxID=421767 RepID=A0AAX0S3Z2_9BACI|nr:hypothetical protein CN689_12470 [Peribacillus butanolivorans]
MSSNWLQACCKWIKATYHTVVKGDTISALAKKYGSTIIQVKDWNKLDSSYTIMVGQKLP